MKYCTVVKLLPFFFTLPTDELVYQVYKANFSTLETVLSFWSTVCKCSVEEFVHYITNWRCGLLMFFSLGVHVCVCVCMCACVPSQPSSRCATPGLSAATLASLGGTSSRRGSTDTGSIYEPDTSLSELRVRCTQSRHSINMTDSSGWKKCQDVKSVLDNYATWNANPAWVVYVYTLFAVLHESATEFPPLWVPAVLCVWINLFFFTCARRKGSIYHVLWSSARMSGWADHVYVCWTVSGMAAWMLNYLSLTFPTFSNLQFNPAFLPCPLQDIYELKDQIQDVEGRYMQGLKELKVEGLELAACLLLFSGTSLASLTLLFLLSLHPPPPQMPCICVQLFAWFSSLHVLIHLSGCDLKRRHSRI